MPDEPTDDPAQRSADLGELARENQDATWGETRDGRVWVPGIISGDLGVKGKVAAQLREQSRRERQLNRQVPSGAIVPGTGKLIVLTMLGLALALLALVAVIVWLVS